MLGDIDKNPIVFIISHNMNWQDTNFTVFQCFWLFDVTKFYFISMSQIMWDIPNCHFFPDYVMWQMTGEKTLTFTWFNTVMHKDYTLYYSMESKPITVSFQRSVLYCLHHHKRLMSHFYWPRIVWGCSMKSGGLVYQTFYKIWPDSCLNISRQTDKMFNNC